MAHDHECAVVGGELAFEPIGFFVEQYQVAAVRFEIDQQLATRGELVVPRRGDAAHGAGAEDPVVRGVWWPALGAVTGSEVGMTPDASQSLAGGVDEFGVDVEGKDVVVAEAVGQQGGVVASASPDLQDPLTVADIEGFKHAHPSGRVWSTTTRAPGCRSC